MNNLYRSVYGAQYASEEGVLLINLGSPLSPRVEDVRLYLETFLMDERVISLSPFWRSLLVKRLIVPRRAPYSAGNYRQIWDEETQSFPLLRHSALLAEALSIRSERAVALAMRYSSPTMEQALRELHALGIKRVRVLPLYPHYTRSSFETAVVHALDEVLRLGLPLELDFAPAFYDHPRYRQVLADSVRPYLKDPFDKLVVSMHGIPLSHLSAPCRAENGRTDYCLGRHHSPQEAQTCYRLHCERSVEMLREDLGLRHEQIELVYQSRLGRHEWIKPYFANRVKQWAGEGVRRVVVVAPGFVTDCLETLQEIQMQYKETFETTGGQELRYIPCLNSSAEFVEVLHDLINK